MQIGWPQELDIQPGDMLECVAWAGSSYKSGEVYPVVVGIGRAQKTIGTRDAGGKWRIASRISLEDQVKELLG